MHSLDSTKKESLLDQLLCQIGDFARDSILITQAEPLDRPGPTIVWCNQAFVNETGYSREEMIGSSPRILHGPNTDAGTLKRIGQDLREWKIVRVDILNYRKDGTEFWSELSIAPVTDENGRHQYWVSTQRDITARKARELYLQKLQDQLSGSDRALAVMNERYEAMAGGSLAGLWDWDTENNTLFWSEHLLKLLGLQTKNFTPSYDDLAQRIHPEDIDRVEAALTAHLENRDVYNIKYRIRHEDGHYIWLHAAGQAMFEASGQQKRMAGSAHDITEEVNRQNQLIEARQAADAANEAKSLFLANMSHELRTPLNGILGMAQVLDMEELNEKSTTYVKMILEAGGTLLTLLNETLDLTRIERDDIKIRNKAFDLRKTLANVFNSVQHLPGTDPIDFKLINDVPTSHTFFGDDIRIRQILTNLLSNAVKFTPNGSITLHVSFDAEQSLVKFIVRDTGIGIKQDNLESIFSRFFQLDDGYSKKYQGAGLGLSIVKGLVDAMQGIIQVKSEAGKGSEFEVRLPLAFDMHEEASRAPEADINNVTVFVAEDNAINRKVLEALFEVANIDGVFVENGEQAIKQYETGRFKAVFLDIGMPKLNGEQVLDALQKSDPKLPPAYAVTGHNGPEDIRRYKAAGFTDVLTKPVDVAKVLEILSGLANK